MQRPKSWGPLPRLILGLSSVPCLVVAAIMIIYPPSGVQVFFYLFGAFFVFLGLAIVRRAIIVVKEVPIDGDRIYTKDPPDNKFPYHS
jgi:hypothetical protein